MKSIPISVWLSAIALFVYSGYSAWQNPMLWIQCFGIVLLCASFVRVAYFLIEGE